MTFELPELVFLFVFAEYMAFHIYYCKKTRKGHNGHETEDT